MFLLVFFLRVFSLLWALAVCPLAILLLGCCATLQGAVFAIGALLLGLAPVVALAKPHVRAFRSAGMMAFGAWLLIALWLFQTSPRGVPREGARVQNRYSHRDGHYQRHALGALLPEIDQFLLGFQLVPAMDSLFTKQQARSLSQLTKSIYAELEADPDFHRLGSVLPEAYDEIWARPFDHGHYFLYIPPQLDRKKPSPALVFLHGSGGNFKAYTWLLSRVADERNMVLIAPTFGFGNWEGDAGSRAVAAALDDAGKVLPLNMNQVHLAGLSNGGLGVSRLAASEAGRRFRSLVFISPVCDETAIVSPTFATQWRDKPVLVVTGDADDRVPLPYVTSWAGLMRTARARVEMSTYAAADHFLLFSHRDKFLRELSAWLKQHSEH
jgi:pimeloyl-ACP methyl ester carboxylesterase